MAKGLNKAMIIGRLGKDPETRYMQNGTAVCNFTVATSEQWNDKATNEKKERTEWHRIVAFGKIAEICGKYLQKGSQVYCEGSLQTRSWEQDGVTRYTTEIKLADMQMLDSKGGQPQNQTSQPQAPYYSGRGGNQPVVDHPADELGDIPF